VQVLRDADSTLIVKSTVGDNSTLNIGTGTATITASIDSSQSSKASGLNGGFIAAGFNDASSTSDNVITSSLGNNVKVNAGTLSINSGGLDENLAEAVAGSGGAFVGSASSAETTSKNETVASIGSGSATRNIDVDTLNLIADHKTEFNSTVDSTVVSIVGASGAKADNTSTSDINVSIGQGMNISAETIDINAINRTRKSTDGHVDVVSASGGLLDGAAAHSESYVYNDTDINIAENVFIETRQGGTVGAFNVEAFNDVVLYDTTKMDSGGAVALVNAESFIYNDKNDADITIADRAKLVSADDMTLEAKTSAIADTEVITKTYGLAGAAAGESASRIKTSNNVSLSGARLESDETIILRAGYNNDLRADAETRLYNRTAIPVETDPDADATIEQDNQINVGVYGHGAATEPTDSVSDIQIKRAAIASVKDIHLEAGDGKHVTRGYGRGTDLYREFIAKAAELFGADISLDITGGSTKDNSLYDRFSCTNLNSIRICVFIVNDYNCVNSACFILYSQLKGIKKIFHIIGVF